MSHLDLNGLQRYALKQREWGDERFGLVNGLNWQKTEKSGAVTCYPVPDQALDVAVDFSFKETLPEGTKGPNNPSTITGVSSVKVTRCGRNLIPQYSDTTEHTVGGVKYKYNGDGSYTINGTADGSNSLFYIRSTGMGGIRLHSGETYTLSGALSSSVRLCTRVEGSDKYDLGTGLTFTAASDSIANCFIMVKNGTTVDNLIIKPQYELGSTATTFEPYVGTDYTIQLGGTYYGGSIDLSTGLMTITWTAIRLGDFQNSLRYNSADNRWEIFVTPKADYKINAICTHSIFKYGNAFTDATDGVFRWAAGNLGQWLWFKSPASTAEAFLAIYENAYVAFALDPPYLVRLSPQQILSLSQTDPFTPRLNTLYADADSIQAGYPKHPARTAYELQQAVEALGE